MTISTWLFQVFTASSSEDMVLAALGELRGERAPGARPGARSFQTSVFSWLSCNMAPLGEMKTWENSLDWFKGNSAGNHGFYH